MNDQNSWVWDLGSRKTMAFNVKRHRQGRREGGRYTERGRRRRAAERSRRPLRRRGVSACASAWREGVAVGGLLLEAAVCFAAVTSQYGERREAHSGGRLRPTTIVSGGQRSLNGGRKENTVCHAGDYAKHFITCARPQRTCTFLCIRHPKTFCFFLSTTEAPHSSEK